MAIDDLKKLESIDLSQFTVSDVKQVKNDALRRSLMEALRFQEGVNSHQNHISHADHTTSPKPPLYDKP
jgi:hypothetical protein